MGFFIMLLVSALVSVVGELIRPKPDLEAAKPNGLGDISLPTATEERVVPLLWGTVLITGPNITWYGDLLLLPVTTKVKTGMFSSSQQVIGFNYILGIQTVLCQGPDVTLRRIYVGDDVILDATASPVTGNTTFSINKRNLFGGNKKGEGGLFGTLRFFDGSPSQAVSSYLTSGRVVSATVANGGLGYSVNAVLTEAGNGTASVRAIFKVLSVSMTGEVISIQLIERGVYTVPSTNPAATTVNFVGGDGCTLTLDYGGSKQEENGVAPAYHDICYTIPDIKPFLYGTSTRIRPWKHECRRIPNGIGITGGKELVDGGANIPNVAYEALTNKEWGYGIDSSKIDKPNFIVAATTLHTEGNGFSLLLDVPMELSAFISMLEAQMDGLLFKNQITGLWQINLSRGGYDINAIPQIDSENILEISAFSRGTWEVTTNEVHTPFNDASDGYKGTFGFAQDMANIKILGSIVTTDISHPGVKSRTLANDIASRELRTLSVPLSQAVFIVDRTLFGIVPGDVVAFTDVRIGFTKHPMRIKSVDYGRLLEGRITLEAVEDIFFTTSGIFAPAPSSGWLSPELSLVPFPANQQVAFEAPRALTIRDPLLTTPIVDTIYAAARNQENETAFLIMERNDPSVTSGEFTEIGEVFGFALIGEIQSALPISATVPLAELLLVATPNTQADLVDAFPSAVGATELGSDLTTLCLVDNEFILIESAEISGSLVKLNKVYRGVLDSVQADHVSGSPVFLLYVGGGMADGSVNAGNIVDVKLLPGTATTDLDVNNAGIVPITFTMANRTRRPMPPSSFALNGNVLDTTLVDIANTGTGDNLGFTVDTIIRRDFRTFDEIVGLTTDAATLDPTFPIANTTRVTVEIRHVALVLTTKIGINAQTTTIRQIDILEGLGIISLPSSLTVGVGQSHIFQTVSYTSRSLFDLTFTIVSALIGAHAFGVSLANITSPAGYAVVIGDDSTDHIFNLSSLFTTGNVEFDLNGAASWATLISAGGAGPGTISAGLLSVGTVITIRHLSTDVSAQKLCTMTVGANTRGYAVFKT